jgi:hypothetical protein
VTKVPNILRREGVFEEEEAKLLEVLGEAHRVDRRQPLVHVMEQLDLVPELFSQVLEELRDAPAIFRWVERVAAEVPFAASGWLLVAPAPYVALPGLATWART